MMNYTPPRRPPALLWVVVPKAYIADFDHRFPEWLEGERGFPRGDRENVKLRLSRHLFYILLRDAKERSTNRDITATARFDACRAHELLSAVWR